MMQRTIARRMVGVALMLLLASGLTPRVRADQPGSASTADSSSKQSADAQEAEALANPSSDERADAAVLEFVKLHQPEMAELITFLKKKQPNDYKEAMRESRKVRDRLLAIKQRDSDLYEVELAIWNNSAQLRLWAASVSAKNKKLRDDDRSKLKELLMRENDLTVQKLTLEKARAEARLNQLDQQLSRRQEQADSSLSKSMKTWENRIERSSKQNREPKK